MNVHLPEKSLNAMNENDVKLNAHTQAHTAIFSVWMSVSVFVFMCASVCESR